MRREASRAAGGAAAGGAAIVKMLSLRQHFCALSVHTRKGARANRLRHIVPLTFSLSILLHLFPIIIKMSLPATSTAAPPPPPLHAACTSEPASAAALADARSADVIFIDNYDSFSYNLVQYLQELGAKVAVFRHDAIDVPTLGE